MGIEGFKNVLRYLTGNKEGAERDKDKAAHDIAKDIFSKSEESVSKRRENHLKYEVASAKADAYDLSVRWLEDEINKFERTK